jgi:hypothetical protein
MLNFHNIIQSLRPDSGFTMWDDNISTIVWEDSAIKTPSIEEIEAQRIKLQTEFEAAEIAAQELLQANELNKTALLERLGITEDEAKLLLG